MLNISQSIRKAIVCLLLICSCSTLMAQQKITRGEYIAQWADVAIEHMEIYGIPASITMAQAIVESGCGNSVLARTANNHFGIKCGNSWTGEKVYHDDDAKGECFRAYASAEESFADHAEFLNGRARYQFLFNYATDDYENWAKGLKQAGYATAPTYAEGLIRVIESEPEPQPQQADQTLAYADRGIDPNNFRVTINSHYGYNVYLTNGSNYIIAREGDTYSSIGKLFELSVGMLRKFNDAAKGTEPQAGDIVYIERKASRWRGSNLIHIVEEGEDLRLLSQVYGVRLKSLLKLNHLSLDAKLESGTTLRLR